MKNYPLWRFKRPGIKTSKTNISDQINPMLIALLLCANLKTVQEVFGEEVGTTIHDFAELGI